MFVSYLQALTGAFGFLTRIPLPSAWFSPKHSIAESAWAFPLVGGIVGMIGGSVFFVFFSLGFGTLLSALLAAASIVFITGALHEDGLSDVADGFFSKNTATERLLVMKDSHIGVFAALTLVVSFLFRILVIARLADYGIVIAFCSLVALEGISRGFMVWFWGQLPLVRANGTAAAAGEPSGRTRYSALISAIVLAFLFLCLPLAFLAFFLALLMSFLATVGFSRLCLKKINGYTGDALGACQQLAWAGAAIGMIIGCHLSL